MWRKPPLDSACWPPLADHPMPWAGLLTSLPDEHDYACDIDGELPGVSGTLYRIGPGLYDRGPDRKRMMLDGDGMVQALTLDNGTARFRNRYVRTEKYLREAEAGRFIYPTFSCHGAGALWRNLGLSLPNQANTTVLEWAGRLRAFDEGQPPYELDLALETIGLTPLDAYAPRRGYWAHFKLDSTHRQLHCLSMTPGPTASATIVSIDRQGGVAARRTLPLPRSVYIHDWFVTPNYFALLLHPAFLSPARIFNVMIGRETFSEAIQWQPERGSILVVAARDSERIDTFDAPVCWMWHAINGFEDGASLVLDFIGSEPGGGLGSDESPLFQAMAGRQPTGLDAPSNFPRRWRVDPARGRIEEQVIDRSANYELPGVSATTRGIPHAAAYTIHARAGELFAGGLCRIDGQSLDTTVYEFGEHEYCGEPVVLDELGGAAGRYLMTQVYRAADRRSYFALFDTQRFADGPIARIRLRHHVPLSFHGFWSDRTG